MGDSATSGESQDIVIVPWEEHWTTDEDAIDSAGPTHVPNSPVVRHDPARAHVPSEQASNAAQPLLCGPTLPV